MVFGEGRCGEGKDPLRWVSEDATRLETGRSETPPPKHPRRHIILNESLKRGFGTEDSSSARNSKKVCFSLSGFPTVCDQGDRVPNLGAQGTAIAKDQTWLEL